MDPVRNPYAPGAGQRPPELAGRDVELSAFDVVLERIARGRPERSLVLTGLRGVGKTVLLGRFYRTALAQDWVVIESEITKHDDSAFRRNMASWMRTALLELSPRARWTARMERAGAVLKSFTLSVDAAGSLTAGINVEALEGLADQGDLQHDLTDLFVAVGDAALDRGRGIVLLLDEVQFLSSPQLEALISALHKTVQRELPVTMVGAGLPQIAELAGDAKSYAERLFRFPRIGNLDPLDAARALADPATAEGATFEPDALAAAVEVTEGYPYFLQELGHAVWTIAAGGRITRDDVDAAIPVYKAKLDQSFFRVRLDRATEMQRVYLRAMAELGPEPHKAADVAALMQRTSPQIAPTRAELIAMGLLYTPEHGYAAFTVPHFDRFMLRAVPELVVPSVRQRRQRATPS